MRHTRSLRSLLILTVATNFLLVGATLTACGEDPILAKAREQPGGLGANSGAPGVGEASGSPAAPRPGVPAEPAPGEPPQPAPGEPPGTATAPGGKPAPGVPAEPPPGDPNVPPPGGQPGAPGSPGGQRQGPQVEISGVVEFSGWKRGQVRINAFDGPHADHGTGAPKIIGEVRIDQPGPFTLTVPQGAGAVYLEAAVDEDEDGRPGPLDPQGKATGYPIQVDASPVTGATIVMERRAPPGGTKTGGDF